jgi:hypothetical protein
LKVLVREKSAHTLARFENTIRPTAPKETHKASLWAERVSVEVTRKPTTITAVPTAAVSTWKASSRTFCKGSVVAMLVTY